MRLEKMLLEYDCFPILAIYVENGKRYFCNGTELRTYERIVAYPATASQLIRVLTNENRQEHPILSFPERRVSAMAG